jgi:hypothetical protein
MDRDSAGETPSALCPPQEAGLTSNYIYCRELALPDIPPAPQVPVSQATTI